VSDLGVGGVWCGGSCRWGWVAVGVLFLCSGRWKRGVWWVVLCRRGVTRVGGCVSGWRGGSEGVCGGERLWWSFGLRVGVRGGEKAGGVC